ncbi:MAG: hypothetical protein ACRCXN_13080, partial [Bacteroidales bacterium]
GDTVVVMENGSPTDKYAEDGTYNVTDESGAKHTLTIAGGVVTEQQSQKDEASPPAGMPSNEGEAVVSELTNVVSALLEKVNTAQSTATAAQNKADEAMTEALKLKEENESLRKLLSSVKSTNTPPASGEKRTEEVKKDPNDLT